MNHRGNTLKEWEIETQNKILPLKAFYYLKFQGALIQYIEFVKSGLEHINEIKDFCDTLERRKVEITPKIVGKIDLPSDNKKRFKK